MKTILKNKKRALLSGVLAVVLLATAGLTLALLIDSDDAVTNTFTPSEVTCEVYEVYDRITETKTDVGVTNTGDTAAYIRATFVVNWVNPQNPKEISSVAVESDDIEITFSDSVKWIQGKDGYFYYTDVVPAEIDAGSEKAKTEVLIDSIKVKDNVTPPDGYVLSVEIIADAIQAEGTDEDGNPPVELAWGVEVVDGKLSPELPELVQ